MEEMYNVSSNPHVRDKMTTSRIMQLVASCYLIRYLEFRLSCTPCSARNGDFQCVF